MKKLIMTTSCAMFFLMSCIDLVTAKGNSRYIKKKTQERIPSPQANHNNNSRGVDQIEYQVSQISLESEQVNDFQSTENNSGFALSTGNNDNRDNNLNVADQCYDKNDVQQALLDCEPALDNLDAFQQCNNCEAQISISQLATNVNDIIGKVEEMLEGDQVQQDFADQLFQVTFKDDREKEYFTRCNNYQFCQFISSVDSKMHDPQVVSMVRHYGFGLGHVPLLLVWSSYLYNRLVKSQIHCSETQDFKDVLMLILIVDIRAQVDAECINYMKENSQSHNALVIQTDRAIIEKNTACAPETAHYLKSKLASLWLPKIQQIYNDKKLPRYTTIMQKVKQLAAQWQEDQLQSPIWVCSALHVSFMTLNNIFSGWQSDRFGNWWDPVHQLITACQSCDYSEVRKPKTDDVIKQLEKYDSWSDYFGNLLALHKEDDAEYDSDGGF